MGQKKVSLYILISEVEMHARVVYTWGGKRCLV